ncbi:MAG: PSD1 and planctomycete cytochrome C domain-containing protein [Planctomycetota bacterium]
MMTQLSLTGLANRLFPLILGVAVLTLPNTLMGQTDISDAHEKFFESKIRPILVKHCYECHSIESGKTRGGLLVDTRDGLLQGGESGTALTPGDLDDSPLWSAINWEDYNMPPNQQLPDHVIADFKKWIEMGAPDPRVREKLVVESTVDVESGRKHWAYQSPTTQAEANIDQIVDQKMALAELTPVAAADASTLLRRVHFDLVGLPPTPQQIAAFKVAFKQDRQAALEEVVDRLLDSPQYGERWGRHWLDVARYAESSGNVNFSFPNAWRYRDYVINSFNEDKPYNEFIQQQIAGDKLKFSNATERQENLTATGFLAIGIKGLNERNPRAFQMDLIDEQIDTTTQAILGLTVSCARCHDHKFDAIPTADYYALAGIFMSTNTYYGTYLGLQNRQPSSLLSLPIKDEDTRLRSFTPSQLDGMKERIESLEEEMREMRLAARRNRERPDLNQFLFKRNQISRLEASLQSVDENGDPKTYCMGVMDHSKPRDAKILVGGDVERPAQEVERGFLTVLNSIPTTPIKAESSGRDSLAQWLSADENPLTARVMVNRIWQHLLGEPIVISPNNFGVTTPRPDHQELLDYLAVKFMKNDWSIKAMVKEIVLSKTYQRDSGFDSVNFEQDPENKLFWRANPRQLDAEALRDTMLAISDTMDLQRPNGSDVSAAGDVRIGALINKDSFNKSFFHRSVYLPIVRDEVPDALALFDFADPNSTNAQRDSTNVASQSLYLMNSELVTFLSEKMAVSLSEYTQDRPQQIERAFQLAYGREPSRSEVSSATNFMRRMANALPEPESINTPNRPFFQRRFGRNTRGQSQSGNRPMQRPYGRESMQGGMQSSGNTMNGIASRFQSRQNRFSQPLPELDLTREQEILAVFCQSLMASAEFRILN